MIGDTFALTQDDLELWKLKRVFSPEEVFALLRQMELTLVLKEKERLAAFEEGCDTAKDAAYDRGYEAGEKEGYRRGYSHGKKGYR